MIDTPDRDKPEGLPDNEHLTEGTHDGQDKEPDRANITEFSPASAVDPDTIARLAAIDDMVEEDLKRLKSVLTALADQLTAHLIQAQNGEVTPSEISGTARQALPLVALLMNQEKKVDDQIQQRVGKAGPFALDLDGARSEIGRRLTGLRRAEAGQRVSGRAE